MLQALWRELNTPDRFSDQPYYALLNAIGHIAVGRYVVETLCAVWASAAGVAPDMWTVAGTWVAVYAVGVELIRQKWFGADTVADSAFVALGAVLVPLSMSVTESGRWFRVEDWSTGFLVWLACGVAALALYVYPRARRAYGGKRC